MAADDRKPDKKDGRLWPWGSKNALWIASLALVSQFALIAAMGEDRAFPSRASDGVLLVAVLGVSAVPILLVVVDLVAERGGSLPTPWGQIDFGELAPAVSVVQLSPNLAQPGPTLADRGGDVVLHELERARNHEAAVLDLTEAGGWWKTRLLLLCSGATRLGGPAVIVFVTGSGSPTGPTYLGWANPRDILDWLLTDLRYRHALAEAQAAASQWSLVAPAPRPPAARRRRTPSRPRTPMDVPPIFRRTDLAFTVVDDVDPMWLPSELAPEHLLAVAIAAIESDGEQAPVSAEHLAAGLGGRLTQTRIDTDTTAEVQLRTFFGQHRSHVAVTQGARYLGLIRRDVAIDEILGQLVGVNPATSAHSG